MLKVLTIAHIIWLDTLRRKDVYVLLILLGSLLVTLVSLDILGLGGVVRYAVDIGLLMAWLFGWILAVSVSSRQLPREESTGTILPLLAKPIARIELLLGKWLGSWSVVTAATLMFYLLLTAVALAKGGRLVWPAVTQGFALHALALAVVSAIGLAFSTRMNYDAAATMTYVLTGASFLVVPRIPEFMARESTGGSAVLLGLYHLLPHFEVFDLRRRIVHDYGPTDGRTLLLAVLYGVALLAVFLFLAWLGYRNKRFSRGSMAS